jgi:hypothetical protein
VEGTAKEQGNWTCAGHQNCCSWTNMALTTKFMVFCHVSKSYMCGYGPLRRQMGSASDARSREWFALCVILVAKESAKLSLRPSSNRYISANIQFFAMLPKAPCAPIGPLEGGWGQRPTPGPRSGSRRAPSWQPEQKSLPRRGLV